MIRCEIAEDELGSLGRKTGQGDEENGARSHGLLDEGNLQQQNAEKQLQSQAACHQSPRYGTLLFTENPAQAYEDGNP